MSGAEWLTAAEGLRGRMEAMHQTREEALRRCRLLIQTSAKSIRCVHRHQFEEAARLLGEARAIAADARGALCAHPSLLYAGYLQDAEKELVEAAAMLAMAEGKPLPPPEEFAFEVPTYLNGMGEAASECRRYVLDAVRAGNLAEGERLLGLMETIYDFLITMDYADSLTGGLRRTCDALRAVIERTRSDLTTTHAQRELLDELRRARGAG